MHAPRFDLVVLADKVAYMVHPVIMHSQEPIGTTVRKHAITYRVIHAKFDLGDLRRVHKRCTLGRYE